MPNIPNGNLIPLAGRVPWLARELIGRAAPLKTIVGGVVNQVKQKEDPVNAMPPDA